MDKRSSLAALAALSQETRLDVFRLLTAAGDQGLPAGDIAESLGIRQNTMSTNLSILHQAGLIRNRREGRTIRYFADLGGMAALLRFLMEECCGGRPELCRPALANITDPKEEPPMSDPCNVLFLCTGNSARSIIAEAIMNRDGKGRFRAYSAGSFPKNDVHPLTRDILSRHRIDPSFARSKSWDEFAGPDAPKMDFVFTVCVKAAEEQCPLWPVQPMSAHWGAPDPAAAQGTDAEKGLAFAEVFGILRNRISIFLSLPLDTLDRLSVQRELDEIGRETAEATAS